MLSNMVLVGTKMRKYTKVPLITVMFFERPLYLLIVWKGSRGKNL
jgi:hypothetical protein